MIIGRSCVSYTCTHLSSVISIYIKTHFNKELLTSHAKNIATPLTRYALDLFIPAVSRNLTRKKEEKKLISQTSKYPQAISMLKYFNNIRKDTILN